MEKRTEDENSNVFRVCLQNKFLNFMTYQFSSGTPEFIRITSGTNTIVEQEDECKTQVVNSPRIVKQNNYTVYSDPFHLIRGKTTYIQGWHKKTRPKKKTPNKRNKTYFKFIFDFFKYCPFLTLIMINSSKNKV